MSNSRLLRELRDIRKSREVDFELHPKREDIYVWYCCIPGPKDTPFEGGFFEVKFNLPSSYPIKSPKAFFMTKIFHPNIHFKTGEVCLDILKTNWSPAWTLTTVVRAIVALLNSPEPSSPLNCDAGNLLRLEDYRGYNSLCRMYTEMCAKKEKLREKYSITSRRRKGKKSSKRRKKKERRKKE